MALTCCLYTFPISDLDPKTMHRLGFTATETLLWDYSNSEEFYVYVIPPAIDKPTLFLVPNTYAYQWYGLNGSNGLQIVYYPFLNMNFTNLQNPCRCPPIIFLVSPNAGFEGDIVVITGLRFTNANLLTFGGVPAVFTFISDTSISAVVPVGAGVVDIQVTTTGGVSELTINDQFTYVVVPVSTGSFADFGIWQVIPRRALSVLKVLQTEFFVPFVEAVAAFVTWDPPSSVEFFSILSDGNLDASVGLEMPQGVSATVSKTTGKWYFEVTLDSENNASQGDYGFGVRPPSVSLYDFANSNTNDTSIVYQTGSISNGGSLNLGPVQQGGIFAVAVDLDNAAIWYKLVAGTGYTIFSEWCGTAIGDPATNTNGAPLPVAAGPGQRGVTGAVASAKTTGKLYFEIKNTLLPTHSYDFLFGVCKTTATYSALSFDGTGGAICYADGAIFCDGASEGLTGGGGPGLDADVVGIAVDLTNRMIWFKIVAGPNAFAQWNNSPTANPATNVGGFPVLAGSIIPVLIEDLFNQSPPAGDVKTANFGGSAFAGTIPVGFSAWDAAVTWDATTITGGLVLSGGNLVVTDPLVPSGIAQLPTSVFDSLRSLDQQTINFGGSAFSGSVPAGFSAWGAGVTYDPATATTVTLSGGNLTVTNIAPSRYPGVQSVTSHSSGKWYCEITLTRTLIIDDSTFQIGVCPQGSSFDQLQNRAEDGTGYIGVQACDLFHNGVFFGTLSTQGTGGNNNVYGMAIDLDNNEFWIILVNGPDVQGDIGWNGNTGDPTTNNGGCSIPINGPTSTVVYASFDSDNIQDTLTANFGGSPFVGASVALNPLDVTSGFTLSNSNLTATSTNTNAKGVRSVVTRGYGKFYVEYTTGASGFSGAGSAVGSSNGSASLTVMGTAAAHAFMVFSNGNIFLNGANQATNIGAFTAAGQVVCMALDMTNSRGWFRLNNGNWNNNPSADPASNVGGINISSIYSPGHTFEVPFLAVSSNATSAAVTANVGYSAFAFAAPSGFSAWGGLVPTGFSAWNAADTWSPAAVNVTQNNNPSGWLVSLSNGNLSVLNLGIDASGAQVSPTYAKSSGKYYYELTRISTDGNNPQSSLTFGLPNPNWINLSNQAIGGVIVFSSGGFFADGYNVTTRLGGGGVLFNRSTGDIIGVAVDLDNGIMWFKVVGGPDAGSQDWNGVPLGNLTQNPNTLTGGVYVPPGGNVPLLAFDNGGGFPSLESQIANFGASAFTGAVPTGFTAGWPTTGGNSPPGTTTWSSDQTFHATLSNGNLTITNSSNSGTNGAMSNIRKRSVQHGGAGGKFYFEFTFNAVGSQTGFGAGISPPGTLANITGALDIGSCWFEVANGLIRQNNGFSGTPGLGALQTGDIIGCAIDLTDTTGGNFGGLYYFKVVAGPDAASTFTKWYYATKSLINTNFVNGLTAQNGGTTQTNQGIQAAQPKSTGKFYFEMTADVITSTTAGNESIGIMSSANTLYSGPTGAWMQINGNLVANGGVFTAIHTLVAGQKWAVAVDLTNRTIWFKLLTGTGSPSDWNANVSADPATNVGGATIPAGNMVPFVRFGGTGGANGDQWTANFGQSAFTGSVPSGFTSGWPSPQYWNGDPVSDPTLANGIAIDTTVLTPFVLFQGNTDTSNQVTANFGATAFSGTVPTGYTSGWTP